MVGDDHGDSGLEFAAAAHGRGHARGAGALGRGGNFGGGWSGLRRLDGSLEVCGLPNVFGVAVEETAAVDGREVAPNRVAAHLQLRCDGALAMVEAVEADDLLRAVRGDPTGSHLSNPVPGAVDRSRGPTGPPEFLPAPELRPDELARVHRDAIRRIHRALHHSGRSDLVRTEDERSADEPPAEGLDDPSQPVQESPILPHRL